MSKFESLCSEYRENKRLIEELQALNDSLKESILAIMAGRETLTEGASKATYKSVSSSRIDSKALKADYPDVARAYTVTSSYKRFTVV